jgi:hypothetical protein
MKRFILLTSLLAALGAMALAGTASAKVDAGGGAPAITAGSAIVSTTSSTEPELTGTATLSLDGTSVTVTGADGSSITCAVPAGMDLTSFLTGTVEAQCESVGGVLTLTEIQADETATETEDTDTGDTGDTIDDDSTDDGGTTVNDDAADDGGSPADDGEDDGVGDGAGGGGDD